MRVLLLLTAISIGSASSPVPNFPSSPAPNFPSSPVSYFASFHLRSSGATADKPHFPNSPLPQSPNVATLYRVHCVMCHGPLGKAAIPEMAFIGRKWKHGTKSADMVQVITNGVKGTPMMPFKGKLKPDEIKALATHVRSFDKTLPPEK